MFEFSHFITLVGEFLVSIDPRSEACRQTESSIADLAVVLQGCYNFGMSAEDTALFVFASETLITD